jgi:hypothetical protein
MAGSPTQTFLEQLRQVRPGTDWRRDRPHPRLPEWRAALVEQTAAGQLSQTEQIEAEALLSRLALDPLATLSHFAALQESARSPSPAAYRMMQELVSHWGDAMATLRTHAGQDEVRSCQEQARAQLYRLAELRPKDAPAQLLLVTFLRFSTGAAAAIDHIASTGEPLPELVREYFSLLIDRVTRLPTADHLRCTFLEPLPFRAPISLDMLRFRFHRALILQALSWNRAVHPAFGDEALQAAIDGLPPADPDSELSTILRLLPLTSANDRAQALMDMMACPALWRSPVAEAPRQTLLSAAMELAPDVADQGLLTSLVARLVEYAPQSIGYWENIEWPDRLHTMVCNLAPRIRVSQRHYFSGITAFPLQKLDVVVDQYRAATVVEPTASRFTSYLDPRTVLQTCSDNVLNADAFRWEVPPPSPGASGSLMVATSADENYFKRYATSYATSLLKIGGTNRLHFHVIGRPEAVAEEFERVCRILPDTQVTLSSEPVLTNRAFYYASARFLRMEELLHRSGHDLLMTDIDLAWHARPELWVQALAEADVGLRIFDRVRHYVMQGSKEIILRYPRTKLWECTSASSIFLRQNAAGVRFAELLARVTSRHLSQFLAKPGTHWFIDQNILSAVYAHALRSENIRIGNLDEVGTPYSPFGLLTSPIQRQTYGHHWIAQKVPFMSHAVHPGEDAPATPQIT